jgi:hypothetical protein
MSKLDEIAARIKEAASLQLSVGFLEGAMHGDKPTAEIAVIHEYGAPAAKIPARPFFQPCIDNNKAMWAEQMQKATKAVINGRLTGEQVLTQMGGQIAAQLKQSITNVHTPELSKTTLMLRKWRREGREITGATVGQAARAVADGEDYSGPDDPLRDTGMMLNQVDFVVGHK